MQGLKAIALQYASFKPSGDQTILLIMLIFFNMRVSNMTKPLRVLRSKKQKNFGTTPKSEVKHLKKWPDSSAEAA